MIEERDRGSGARRGRISEYAEKFKAAVFTSLDPKLDHNPLWDHQAQCAFPSATQNEINEKDAANLLRNGVYVVSEGANMPTTIGGIIRMVRIRCRKYLPPTLKREIE